MILGYKENKSDQKPHQRDVIINEQKTIHLQQQNDNCDEQSREEMNKKPQIPFSFTLDDITNNFSIISDPNSSHEVLLPSLYFFSQVSLDPAVCNDLFNNNIHFVLMNILESPSLPHEIVSFCLTVIINILNLPDKITSLILTPFPRVLWIVTNNYAAFGHPSVVSCVLDILKVIARPPISISFYIDPDYLTFLYIQMDANGNGVNENTVKAFDVCNCLYNISHLNLNQVLMERGFVDICYRHINRRTLAYSQACYLLGNIGNFNRYIIEHLPDDFLDLVYDLLNDEDEAFVGPALIMLQSLATNKSISELFVKNRQIIKRIFRSNEDRSFRIQILSLKLLAELMRLNYVLMECVLIEYGTLDFFRDYLETEDADIVGEVFNGLNHVFTNFLETEKSEEIVSPFVSVVINSTALIEKIHEISLDPQYNEQINEASKMILSQVNPIFERLNNNQENV